MKFDLPGFFKGPGSKPGSAPKRREHLTQLAHNPATSENPYIVARKEWNERYGDYIAQKRTWQIVALCSLALSGVLAVSLVKIASQAKVQPFVVVTNELGKSLAVRPADVAEVPDERIIRYQLADFIDKARSVTPDALVQKRWLDAAYAVVTPPTAEFLNAYYRKNSPFDTAKNAMVAVEVQTALPLSKKTWQVEWTETRRGLNGQTEGITRWKAVLTTNHFTPTTQQEIVRNPTGVFIEQISWTQQL